MSSIGCDLDFLVLRYLQEKGFKETAHRLEQESGIFFNVGYLEESVLAGDWEQAERYLSGFTKFDDNPYSMGIYFMIRQLKYLEAVDRHDRHKAVDILVNDLSVFSTAYEDIMKELTLLLSLDNIRVLSEELARKAVMEELKVWIESNPLLSDKLQFPPIENQSLNWQHRLWECLISPRPDRMNTLFVDHGCP